jgi:hypothetical protein
MYTETLIPVLPLQVAASVRPAVGSTNDLQLVAKRAEGVKALFRQWLQLEPSNESKAYVNYLVPRAQEGELVGCLRQLEEHKVGLGPGGGPGESVRSFPPDSCWMEHDRSWQGVLFCSSFLGS